MTNHREEVDFYAELFHRAVVGNLDEEDNREAIHADFDQLMDDAIGAGEVIVTGREVKRLAKRFHWTRLNNLAGRSTQKELARISRGEVHLFEVDTVLDTVITAGKNRRTTIRHMVGKDLWRATDERQHNMAKQQLSLSDWLENVEPTLRVLLETYGTLGSAFAAGAVPVIRTA